MLINRLRKMSFDAPFHLIGNVALKSLPILIGLMLARFYSKESYLSFVDALITANLIVSFATMGFGSQLYIHNATTDYKSKTVYTSVIILLLSVLGAFFYYYWNGLNDYKWFTISYAVFFGLANLFSMLLNGKMQYRKVSLIWLSIFLLICFSAIIGLYSSNPTIFLIVYATSFGLVALLFYSISIKNLYIFRLFDINWFGLFNKSIIFNAIKLSLFSITFLFGYKLLVSYEFVNINERSVLVASFQFFTIVNFIPSVMGGFFIPKFSQQAGESSSVWKVLFSYIAISVIICLVIFFLRDIIFKLYRLDVSITTSWILFWMLLASALSSISTFFYQIFNSKKKYGILLIGSSIWLLVISLLFILDIENVKTFSQLFCFSYFMYGLSYCLVYLILKRYEVI